MFESRMKRGRWQTCIVSPTWQTNHLAQQLLPDIFPDLGVDEAGGSCKVEVILPLSATLSLEAYKKKADKSAPGHWYQAQIRPALPPGSFDLETQSSLSTFVEQALGWRRQAAVLVSPERTSLLCEPLSLRGERANQAYELLALNWSEEPVPQQTLRDARLLKDYLRSFLCAAFAAVRGTSSR